MARVLISAFSNVGWVPGNHHDTFVVGFMNALERAGNHVLVVRCNDFMVSEHTDLNPYVNRSSLVQAVKTFAPDIIITLNNMFPCGEFITDTDCPIFIYPADGYDFFKFKDLIGQHLERFFFFHINEDNYNDYKENIPSLKDERLCRFSYATDFRPRDVDQDLPLSFLGSLPNHTFELGRYFTLWPVDRAEAGNEVKKNFCDELDRFRLAPHSKFNCDLPGFQQGEHFYSPETIAVFLITTKKRFEILSSLADMGLSIYGYSSFCMAGIYNYDLLRAFNYEQCITVDQAETLYNRSQIALNLPNARSTRGFSWRVPDVLATNSVLLSFFSPDLSDLMRGYADLPMYTSVTEARTIAEKLLKDEIWRRDLSEASRKMIEDKCRFEPNFKNMEEASGVTLHSDKKGVIEHLFHTEHLHDIISEPESPVVSEADSPAKVEPKTPRRAFSRLKKELVKTLPYFIAKKFLGDR